MLEAFAILLAVVVTVSLVMLWAIVQLVIIMLPVLVLATGGYGLFILATMVAGSPRSKTSTSEEDKL